MVEKVNKRRTEPDMRRTEPDMRRTRKIAGESSLSSR
jgi:hypothetical protein